MDLLKTFGRGSILFGLIMGAFYAIHRLICFFSLSEMCKHDPGVHIFLTGFFTTAIVVVILFLGHITNEI